VDRTFCIVAQGGGMIASYQAGVIRALKERFGLSRLGRVVASSGAAMNFSYVVSGQEHLIEPIWDGLIQSGRFISSLRHIHRRGVMDIDFLVDEMIRKRFPLDVAALMHSPVKFDVGVTHAITGSSWYFSKNVCECFFYELLRASCAVPYFYGKQVYLNGEYWYDGTIGSVVGLEQAINEQNILFILTRPPRPIRKLAVPRMVLRWLLLRSEHQALQRAILNMPREFNRALEDINELKKERNIVVIQPRKRLPIWRIDTSMERLRATIEQGYQDTLHNKKELEFFFAQV